MPVTLSLTYTQANDNKTITFTDSAGVYNVTTNPGGWGDANPETRDIDSTTNTLTLGINVITPDGTTSYNAIDLYATFAGTGFDDVNDLVFAVNASHLISDGSALGTSEDELPDGIYEITYTISDAGSGSPDVYTQSILIDGQVRNSVYENLRALPTTYACNECRCEEMYEAVFSYSYLKAIEYSAYVAKEEELINQLETLQGVVLNGSNCTWYSD